MHKRSFSSSSSHGSCLSFPQEIYESLHKEYQQQWISPLSGVQKHNIEAKMKHPVDPFKNKRVKTQVITSYGGSNGMSKIKDKSAEIFQQCLQRMPQGTWYRINPDYDEESNTIASAIGQSWILLRPLLIHLNYFLVTDNHLKINVTKFQLLSSSTSFGTQINFGSYRSKGKPTQYFLCRGSPHISNPAKQNLQRNE